MQLRNIHAYSLIRLLRGVLPVVVLALVAVLLWNYRAREATPGVSVDPRPGLVENVREVTEDIQYAEREDGRTVFTVEAARNFGMADGRQLLEGVRIRIAGQDASTPDRLIDSDHCGLDQASGNIGCTGNIEIRFDDETVIRTMEILYNSDAQVITTLRSAEVVRPGAFEAHAERLSLGLGEDVLEVDGGVRVTTEGGVTLEMDSARYYRAEDRVELRGSVRLGSARGEIRGRQSRVALAPETLDPRQIVFSGSVFASSAETENPLSVGADFIQVDLAGPRLERVTASGAARVEASDATGGRVLVAGTIAGYFAAAGDLELIDAVDNARLLFSGGHELRSDRIRNEVADATIRSGAASILEFGGVVVEGDEFVMRQSDVIEFTTARPSAIRTPDGTLRAPVTSALIDPDSGTLTTLVQTGGARFSRDGLDGRADRIEVRDDGGIVLSGEARISEQNLQLDGDEILLDEDGERFSAAGGVIAVLSGDGPPSLVEGGRAEGDRRTVTFYSSPQLWRDNVQVRASNSIEIRVDERRFLASGEVVSTLGDSRVWSDRVDYTAGADRVTYSGSVRGYFPEAELDAAEVEVYLLDGQLNRILANREVEVRGSGIVGRGDRATYDTAIGTVTLTGSSATVSGPDTGLATGPRFVWNVRNNQVVMTGDDDLRAVTRRTLETR